MGKEYRIGPEGGLEVVWTVENVSAQPWDAVLFVDLNMTVLSPIGPDRWLGVDGDRRAPAERRDELGVEQVELGDATRDLRLVIEPSEPAGVWAFPVETVSSSESGFERTYQGTCLTFRWGMALDAGETAMRSLRLSDPPPEDAVAVSRGDG